jgi:hypothetical protein
VTAVESDDDEVEDAVGEIEEEEDALPVVEEAVLLLVWDATVEEDAVDGVEVLFDIARAA